MSCISKGTLLALFMLGVSAYAADKPVPTIIYLGATVIDTATGASKPNVAIFTRGQRIVAIRTGEGMAPQKGQQIVDVRGKFIIPGLVN